MNDSVGVVGWLVVGGPVCITLFSTGLVGSSVGHFFEGVGPGIESKSNFRFLSQREVRFLVNSSSKSKNEGKSKPTG